MAGLLGGVLPAIYSTSDQIKRQIYGLLTNPSEMAQRAGQSLLQSRAERQALMGQAFANPDRPLQVTNPQALAQLGQDVLTSELGIAPVGMIAYHGTPHLIKDKFDISKVGTGEGAQSYGHGMYFAENPAVADSYKIAGSAKYGDPDAYANMMVKTYSNNPDKALKVLNNIMPPKGQTTFSGESRELVENAIKSIQSGTYKGKDFGNLYKVDIPDEYIPKMLDWDKGIDEQTPEVKNIISNYVKSTNVWKDYYSQLPEKAKSLADDMVSGVKSLDNLDNWKKLEKLAPNLDHNVIHDAWTTAFEGTMKSNLTGKELYKTFDYIYGSPERAAEELKNQGIQGIRYLDQFSRQGGGTSNFVVFDPTDVKILERNNEPLEGLLD